MSQQQQPGLSVLRPSKTPKEFLATMPNLCGEIARYIYGLLEWDQPMLAMGAAVSFTSFLYTKRFSNAFNISSHTYCALIADSGTGKSQCQEAIQNIITETGLQNFLMGKPRSDSGLLSAIDDISCQNRKFLIWDEFGIALGAIAKSTNSYQTMILSQMMDLFSAANRQYIGDQYSRAGERGKRVDITKPCLTILGASTPDRFFGALSEEFVLDGYLSRWLLFFGEEKPKGKVGSRLPIPSSIIEQIKSINEGKVDPKAGDVGQLLNPLVEPLVYDKVSEELAQQYSPLAKAYVTEAGNKIERIFNTRLFEQVAKLSTTFSKLGICSRHEMGYAISLGEFLVGNAARACLKNLFDNNVQRSENKYRDKILNLFPSVGTTLTRTEIARKFPRDSRLRKQTLIDLQEEGILKQTKDGPTDYFMRIL